ncbi:AAA family ATPase [Rhizobium laguerreae]|nr:AAA family ATPase [Rhizobium laguerreae]
MRNKYIDSIGIRGFLGQNNIEVRFDQSINFIIGLNGTGKTTLINLIRSALNCDTRALRGADFEEISIYFIPVSGKTRPNLRIIKRKTLPAVHSVIEYQYKNTSKSDPVVIKSTAENIRYVLTLGLYLTSVTTRMSRKRML